MAETRQTADTWPFAIVGPETPCSCGCCKFARLQDGRTWRCESCGAVATVEPVGSEAGDERPAGAN